MKTVNDLLQSHYLSADATKLQLSVNVDLAFLRANASVLGTLPLTESVSRTSAAPTKKTGDSHKRTSAAPKAHATSSPNASSSKTSVESIAAAIKAGHTTPTNIAQHLGVGRKLIDRALSRHVNRGAILRVAKGQYGVK